MSIRPRQSLLNPALQRPSALQSVPRSCDQIWLDKNENLDPAMTKLAQQVLAEIPPIALASYPEAGDLYRKLAHWTGVTPDSLLLTPGSDGAIRLVYEAFVEHGDSVVHTDPTFAMYSVYSQMFGARALTVEYQPHADGPRLDVEHMSRLVRDERPKLLCLPNPDSPTGTVVSPGGLQALLADCESAGTLFLVDEAYHPFHEDSVVAWTAQSRNLIVARTFAKAWGVAGLRIGYAVAHPDTIGLLHKMRPMYETSTLAIEFMTRMLDHVDAMQASVKRTLGGKAFFAHSMRDLGFRVLPTSGNFLHVAFGGQAPAVHAALKGKVLYRANFEQACLAGFSRFSMAPQEVLEPVVKIIQQAVKSTS
jgi:histidinol-phosphate aminotransferase